MSTQTVTLDSQISLRLCSLATGNFLVFIFHRFSISCAAFAIHLFIGRHTQNAPAPRRGVPWHTFRYMCVCKVFFIILSSHAPKQKQCVSVCVRHEFHTSTHHTQQQTQHEVKLRRRRSRRLVSTATTQQMGLNQKFCDEGLHIWVPFNSMYAKWHARTLVQSLSSKERTTRNRKSSEIPNRKCQSNVLRCNICWNLFETTKHAVERCAWKRKNLLTIIPSPIFSSSPSRFHRHWYRYRSHTIRFNLTKKIEIKWN